MTLRDKIRANAQPFLQAGEAIEAVIPAQTVRQYWSLLSFWLVARDTHRVIVATDRRILLCRSGRFTETPVRGVLAEFPRRTVIGPAHGLWYRTDKLSGNASSSAGGSATTSPRRTRQSGRRADREAASRRIPH